MKFVKFTTLLVLASVFLWQCSTTSEPVGDGEIDYGNIDVIDYGDHVQPLLNEYKGILENAGIYPTGLDLSSWQSLIRGYDHGEVIIAYDGANSLLVELTSKLDNPNELSQVKIDFLKRWIDEGAKNDAGEVPYANSGDRLYVCSQDEAIISIIDTEALVVIRNIHLTDYGFPARAKPHYVEFSPDKQFWFVSCIDNQVNKVLKFRVDTNELVGQVDTEIPALMDHHPTDDILYVSRFMLNNTTTSIIAVNSQTMQPVNNGNEGKILLPPGLSVAHAMRVSGDGAYAYTASIVEDEFLVINHANGEFEDAISLGNDRAPLQMSLAPDNQRAYVSCIGTGEVVVVNLSNPANRFEEAAISLGGNPWHSIFNADGSKLFVGNLMMHNYSVINVSDNSVQSFGAGDGSDGLSQPHGIEISPDGQRLFIACRNTTGGYQPRYAFENSDNRNVGTVVVINTADNTIEKVLEIENFGAGIALLKL